MAVSPVPKSKYGARGYAPTLGWYLARRWLLALGFTLLGLGSFMVLVNGLEALQLAAEKDIAATTALIFSLFKLPDLLLQLLPFAILIGTLAWLHGLQQRGELVALRAAGLPARRFLLAPLLCCLLVGVGALVIGNPVAATLLKRHNAWERTLFTNNTQGVLTPAGSLWLRQDLLANPNDNQQPRTLFLYGGQVAAQGQQLTPATAFVFNISNTLELRLDAEQVTLEVGFWHLKNVTALRPNQPIVQAASVKLPTTLTPAQLTASLNPPPTLSVWQLQQLVQVLRANGWPSGAHQVALHNLYALPLLGLVMLLLAVPFGLRPGRLQGLLSRIGLGLGLGFGFFILRNWVGAYAVAGRLEPWLAAAVPVLVGFLLAMFLLIYLREE